MPGLFQALFWLGITTLLYTYFGYPFLAAILARIRPRPVAQAPITPTVGLVIPAYNEEDFIAEKIRNSQLLDYPSGKLSIVVVADGSSDNTVLIASQYPNVRVYHQMERRGKAAAVNRIMPEIDSEIVVFTDANAMLVPWAVRAIVRNFADPAVAGVAGEKRVLGGGEGLYWRYESWLKRLDSQLSSVMGAPGELFAVRRELIRHAEEDSIIEDFVMSMRLVAGGRRVVYEPQAVAVEQESSSVAADWHRRTRIAAGGIQAILRLSPLMNPRRGIVAWQFVSHRALRWAVTPLLLPLTYLANLLLWRRPFYRFLLACQTVFYGVAILGYTEARRGRKRPLLNAVFYFCLTNLAAIVGLFRYVAGKQSVAWKKVR